MMTVTGTPSNQAMTGMIFSVLKSFTLNEMPLGVCRNLSCQIVGLDLQARLGVSKPLGATAA